jgi:PLP dependent protein
MSESTIKDRLHVVQEQILEAEARYGRAPGSVELLAVSKTKPLAMVLEALDCGQVSFGENQLQDAMTKVEGIGVRKAVWHFIGPVQSNKTRTIATHFDWVHSIDRLRVAERLSTQRPEQAAPLNVCVQFNVSGEGSKSGVNRDELRDLCRAVSTLPGLTLRGLMAIPAPAPSFEAQREALCQVREALESVQTGGIPMDTLSMGMTADLEAAVAEGSTMVRIGTAIFGSR